MRSSLAQRVAPTGAGEACRPTLRCGYPAPRCPQHQHVASCATYSGPQLVSRLAAAAETAEAEVAVPSAVTAEPQATQSTATQKRKSRSSDSGADAQEAAGAIIVLDKPVTNSIVLRLAEVPEAVLRAGRSDDATTYKAVAAVASAQRQLSAQNKVAVYVPYTKASRFTAQLLTADASILDSISTQPLTAKSGTDAAALGNTLAFALLRDGGATVASAGAAATAKAAEAMRVARALLLKKGFEIGVVPLFAESIGSTGQQITILRQEVVVKEMPPPEVTVPSSPSKTLDPAAAAVASLLQRQRRCTLRVRQGQLQRLSEFFYKAGQPRGRAVSQAAKAVGAAAVAAGAAGAQANVSPRVSEARAREARQTLKPRLLLVSYNDTSMPTPKGGSDSSSTTPPAAAEVPGYAYVTCEVLRSRFTFIPEPKLGLAGPKGPMYARKPVVATQDSSVAGLVGALENKVARLGAAWLSSDGTVAGNKAAWEAFTGLGRKLTARTGKSPLLALVRVEQDTTVSSMSCGTGSKAASSNTGSSTGSSTGSGTSSGTASKAVSKSEASAAGQSQEGTTEGTEAAAAADEQQEAGEDKQQQAGDEQQQQQQKGQARKQPQKGAALPGYRLHMLIVQDEDVSRSVMQAPNAPLESSKVTFKQALQLIKFAAAANCFLPVGEASGTGGLVLLPAVLPAPQPAMDYRFASATAASGTAQQERYDYYFRVQRYTEALPAGGLAGAEVQELRVSSTTDPTKLRDAVVAKMLNNEPATLRFTAPAGQLPLFMLSVAMTAVAAARVRLQSKQAAVDVGVMPLILPDTAEGEKRAQSGQPGQEGKGAKRKGVKGEESVRVVYSLRLVPLPAAIADEAQLQLPE